MNSSFSRRPKAFTKYPHLHYITRFLRYQFIDLANLHNFKFSVGKFNIYFSRITGRSGMIPGTPRTISGPPRKNSERHRMIFGRSRMKFGRPRKGKGQSKIIPRNIIVNFFNTFCMREKNSVVPAGGQTFEKV